MTTNRHGTRAAIPSCWHVNETAGTANAIDVAAAAMILLTMWGVTICASQQRWRPMSGACTKVAVALARPCGWALR